MDRKLLGRIPALQIVIGMKGHPLTVSGAADTGSEGLASIQPYLAQRLGIVPTRMQKIVTATGEKDVPVGVVDVLGVAGYPDCSLAKAEVFIYQIPGGMDVLLGERFFEKFTFDIDYSTGRGIVTCGKPSETDWVLPVAIGGGLAVVGLAIYLLTSK